MTATENTTETEAPFVRLNLCCPYCNGDLRIETEFTGYGAENTPESIECTGANWCGAVFETDGVLRDEPNYIRWPEGYTKGEN